MNPSPTEIVDLFVLVEVTLIQYATVAGHFPGVNASSVKLLNQKLRRLIRLRLPLMNPAKGISSECHYSYHTQTEAKGSVQGFSSSHSGQGGEQTT